MRTASHDVVTLAGWELHFELGRYWTWDIDEPGPRHEGEETVGMVGLRSTLLPITVALRRWVRPTRDFQEWLRNDCAWGSPPEASSRLDRHGRSGLAASFPHPEYECVREWAACWGDDSLVGLEAVAVGTSRGLLRLDAPVWEVLANAELVPGASS